MAIIRKKLLLEDLMGLKISYSVDTYVIGHAQVVLELQDDGKLITSDDPPVVFGCLDLDFIQKVWLMHMLLGCFRCFICLLSPFFQFFHLDMDVALLFLTLLSIIL